MLTLRCVSGRRGVAALGVLGALAAPTAAEAVPRLSAVQVAPNVPGKLSRTSGFAPITCTATGPVTATFTSSEGGTLYAAITDGAFLRPGNTGIGRATIRRGPNTIDLAQLTPVSNGPRPFYDGPLRWSRTLVGETAGPVRVGWKVILLPTDRFGLPGGVVNRAVQVTCTF